MHTLTYEEIDALSNKYSIYMDTWADDYGEPGYSLSEDSNGVLFGNWNNCPSHVAHVLGKQFDLEWLDEWITNTDSCKAYRTSPDSYGWLPYYVVINGEVWGGDECENDPEWFIEEYLLDNPDHVLMRHWNIDLENHRFALCSDEYENGWYPGQNDDPHKILKEAQSEWPECEFAFGDCSKGQFDVAFSLYRRERAINEEKV